MGRTAQRIVNSKIQGGLVTQSTLLTEEVENFTALLNMVPDSQGYKVRRKGVDLEEDFVVLTNNTLGATEYAYTRFEWDSVANDPNHNILAVQWGNELIFMTRDSSDHKLSANQEVGTTVRAIDLRLFINNLADPDDVVTIQVSMSAGNGELFVTGQFVYPFRVSWTGSDFRATTIHPIVRDFRLAPDGLPLGGRPPSLSSAHEYNLKNHGWTSAMISDFFAKSGSAAYPANADVYFDGVIIDPSTGDRTFSITTFDAISVSRTVAPSGSYFYDAQFPDYAWINETEIDISSIIRTSTNPNDIRIITASAHGLALNERVFIKDVFCAGDTSTVEKSPMRVGGVYEVLEIISATQFRVQQLASRDGFIGNFTYISGGTVIGPLTARPGIDESALYSPASVRFISERLWLGNVVADTTATIGGDFQSTVFFSEAVRNTDSYNRFYQEADPTAETRNTLVATDGGAIPIADMGLCEGFIGVGAFLCPISSKGVWSITGSDQNTFRADSFSLDKASNVGLISRSSIVEPENAGIFWSDQGIYGVQVKENGVEIGVNSLIAESIQPTFNDISQADLRTAAGVYDPSDKEAVWIYGSGFGVIYDIRNDSWHPITIGAATEQEVVGLAILKGNAPKTNRLKLATRYQLSPTDYLTFSEFSNREFVDWPGLPGGDLDFDTHWETANVHLDFPSLDKEVIQATVFFRKTESNYITDANGDSTFDFPSGATVQFLYDWSDANADGKQGPIELAYDLKDALGDDPGGPVVTGSQMVSYTTSSPGNGKAIRIRGVAEDGKDMQLVGWAMNLGIATDEQ